VINFDSEFIDILSVFEIITWIKSDFLKFQVGGIYTVIRSKVPVTKREFGDNYIAIGPLNEASIRTEVEIREPDVGAIRASINAMRSQGVKVTDDFFLFVKKKKHSK
jgi:hypothetical protein